MLVYTPEHQDLEARIENYELAFRMQMSVPEVMDLSGETLKTQESYGLNNPETAGFGKQCLMARRLVESGVRFVQIFAGGWDSHDYLERGHSSRIKTVDQIDGSLDQGSKSSRYVDETLVVWTGEWKNAG